MEGIAMHISRPRRANGVIVFGLAFCLCAMWPKSASAVSSASQELPKTVLEEFKGLCVELADARERLSAGRIDESAFADTLLSIFIRADRMAQMLAAGSQASPSRAPLQRGTAYLIEALRENWIGIAGRNGMSFVQADLALKAAVAWRSNVTEGPASP
jgi:hypothetical protein